MTKVKEQIIVEYSWTPTITFIIYHNIIQTLDEKAHSKYKDHLINLIAQ